MTSSNIDHKSRPIVVVTGMGVVTSLGLGKQDNWQAIRNGQSGIHKIARFPTDSLKTKIAGTVDFMKVPEISAPCLSYAMADATAEEALAQSGYGHDGFPGPLFFAVPPVELEWEHRFSLMEQENNDYCKGYQRLMNAARAKINRELCARVYSGTLAYNIACKYGTRGFPISMTTACASGATAIQHALEAIRRGDTELALCLASDGSVNAEGLIRFSLLSALTVQNEPPEKASKPFSKNRDGFVMAEGSAALVLESMDHAKARGAKIFGIICGVGETADDFHRTRSKPDGSSIISAIKSALDDSGINISDIDYINAHGTSTPENDRMEYHSLFSVFGDSIRSIPISSNKSMIGHTLTAGGMIEAVFSLMTLREGTIPPTINYDHPDPDIPLDVVPNVKRDANVNMILSNSFGFGGQNACLIFGNEPR